MLGACAQRVSPSWIVWVVDAILLRPRWYRKVIRSVVVRIPARVVSSKATILALVLLRWEGLNKPSVVSERQFDQYVFTGWMMPRRCSQPQAAATSHP